MGAHRVDGDCKVICDLLRNMPAHQLFDHQHFAPGKAKSLFEIRKYGSKVTAGIADRHGYRVRVNAGRGEQIMTVARFLMQGNR